MGPTDPIGANRPQGPRNNKLISPFASNCSSLSELFCLAQRKSSNSLECLAFCCSFCCSFSCSFCCSLLPHVFCVDCVGSHRKPEGFEEGHASSAGGKEAPLQRDAARSIETWSRHSDSFPHVTRVTFVTRLRFHMWFNSLQSVTRCHQMSPGLTATHWPLIGTRPWGTPHLTTLHLTYCDKCEVAMFVNSNVW